ncbi:unnamed protein product [Schistosoma curassoni]|uniref:PDGF_2 domain-containing protein n=1 Tax=Schistosoma curassoni TaxID=6186 RepID=A0A183JI85_9TREM|nr:unnamed protein product [Schistosoma curassoni]
MVSKRCYNNKRLLIRKMFSTLVKGKCLPSEAVYKKPIKCPDPIKKTQCYNNGRQLMHITTTYSLDGDKCRASEQLLDIDPCAHVKKTFNRRPLFQIGRCNPATCIAKRVDYRFSSKDCQCEIQKKVSNEICCCPKPIINQSICDPNTNAIIHKQIHYSLIIPTYNTKAFKSYCQSKLSQISVQVKCGKKLQRIRIKPCDGEFHIVSILKPIVENCICKQKLIHKQKIRCGKL